MTIKQLGGVFGRNPTFNDVTGADGNFVNLDVTNNANIGNDVGIGTTVPDQKLEIKETSTGAGDAIIRLRGSGANADNTPLGSVEWYNADTTGDQPGVVAAVEAQSDSSLGNKGKLIFKTHDGSEGGAGSAPVERMRIDSDGNVALALGNLVISTSGKGIDFSATAGTGTSELLDDYEEGVWTPAPASGTLTINDATYTKVGRLVTAQADVTATATTSGDWSGLPFNLGGSLSADKQVGFVGYQSEESSAVWGVLADNTLATFTFRNGSTSKQLTTGSRAVFTIIYYTN